MAASNPAAAGNLQENIQGIILRSSAAFFSRYAYFSLPSEFPTAINSASLNAVIADSLTIAPHFPHITILDTISGNILYQTYNSFPTDFFHVYNLITRIHFPVSFPYRYPYVNAAIAIHERIHFKVLVVCIEERSNPLFGYAWDGTKPLVFFIYSSKSRNWSRIQSPSSTFTSDQLLPNRRKPIHAGDDVVYLDLTDRFLIRFVSMEEQLDPVHKLVSPWERDSTKLEETTRYGGCRGWLHCAKFNPIKLRVEIYVWTMEPLKGMWRFVATGKEGSLRGKVILGLHPNDESLVFMRSEANDEILMVDIRRDLQWVVIGGRGPKCSQACFLKGMTAVSVAALESCERLKPSDCSDCGILHPHENDKVSEGEFFVVSFSGAQLSLHSSNPMSCRRGGCLSPTCTSLLPKLSSIADVLQMSMEEEYM